MGIRVMIRIDEELCDGCGQCVPSCEEGAIRIVDGKARLVSEVFCDGLGACLGECPRGALSLEEREAAPFDPAAVEAHLLSLGRPELPTLAPAPHASGCPGSQVREIVRPTASAAQARSGSASELRQWPIQLHLLPPHAPFLRGADLLLAADCTAFALGGFHGDLLAGRALAIACPKLDHGHDVYLDKLVAMIDQAQVRSLTVAVMQVPCCGGLVQMALAARTRARRQVPIRTVVVGIGGEILADDAA